MSAAIKAVTEDASALLVEAAVEYCPPLPSLRGAILAGGFIRDYRSDYPVKDMDLFFGNELLREDAKSALLRDGWRLVRTSTKAMTLKRGQNTVQLITRNFRKPEDLIYGFDFTVCAVCVARVKGRWKMYYHPNWLDDVDSGRLDVLEPVSVRHTLQRMADFLERGIGMPTPDSLRSLAAKLAAPGDNQDAEYPDRSRGGAK